MLMMEQKEKILTATNMSAATAKEELRWWAMSAVYNRSMKVKQMLDGWGVENFVPMKTVVRTYAGRKTRQRIPAISDKTGAIAASSYPMTIWPLSSEWPERRKRCSTSVRRKSTLSAAIACVSTVATSMVWRVFS